MTVHIAGNLPQCYSQPMTDKPLFDPARLRAILEEAWPRLEVVCPLAFDGGG